jgi:hypothetical protein
MYFKGKDNLLLQEYFDLKVKLFGLQSLSRFKNNNKEIEDVEVKIIETLGMFNTEQIRQIIYMSLNIDYEKLVYENKVK